MLRPRRQPLATSAAGIALVLTAATLGIVACGPGDSDPETPAPSDDLATFLPSSAEITGWSRATEVDRYDPDTLYEYIDGEAPFYLDYGFRQVVTAEYAAEQSDLAVVVEIFQMGSSEEAFGIFAAERSAGDREPEVGAQAYASSNVVGLWKGPHYVKVSSFVTGDDVENALFRFAEEVASRLPGESTPPPLFELFPLEGRVARSERFIPRDVLGQAELSDGYLVGYSRDGDDFQMVVIRNPTEVEPDRSLTEYLRFLEQRGDSVIRQEADGQALFVASGETHSAFFQLGTLVGGVLEADDPGRAETAARELMSRLREPEAG
jgi:hypothetical protein